MTEGNIMAETPKYFSALDRFTLSEHLLAETVARLREEGQFQMESIVFWIGSVEASRGAISQLVVPRGPGVFKHPYQVRVSENIIAGICELLDPPRAILLGQVHTHMYEAFHSPTDDRFSLGTPGYLSLVVPNFARDDPSRWRDWGFYECAGLEAFRRLGSDEVLRRFVIEPARPVTVHVISG